ncbi:GDPmannose 4,6-dehydratase, partial [Larkinella arboricola]
EVLSIDERYFRPTEVDLLLGDPTKAMTKLNWTPKYDLAGLVKDMMQADVALFRRDQLLAGEGHLVPNYYE